MAIDKIEPEALSDATVTQTTQKVEFYGFYKDSNGNLLVDTTDGGNDPITDVSGYDDYMMSIQGITFQIGSTGNLEMVIN
jgi:hypothetical protein